MVISIIAGYAFLIREHERIGLTSETIGDAAFWAVIGGIVGARLVFVASNNAGWFIHDPTEVLRIWQGGLSWHGAVGGGVLGAWLFLRKRDVVFAKFLDAVVPGIAVGIILVRVGNIFNHEVLGHPSSLLGGARWPVQPIGSAIGIFLLLRYFWYRKRDPNPGAQFWSMLFWYSLLRGVIEETLRQDPTLFIHYANPHLGIGFTTVLQVWTPLLLAGSWFFWRRAVNGGGRRVDEARDITA